jgi:hypothetical protein
MEKGFYITRDKGNWYFVTPFRRMYCFDLNDAVEQLMK